MKTRLIVLLLLLLIGIQGNLHAAAPVQHTFGWKGEDFLLDGKPFVIRGGEMHFSRIPREHWRDRLRMLKAMGLNTVGTYLFWNLHEPHPGQFDFEGSNDIAAFVRIAQEEGLWVIIRPGPYSCAEWEFGGFPSWLLKTPDMRVRTSDPRYVAAVTRYLHEVGKQLAPLQVTHGGPIIMVQVENEYGSFGGDMGYKTSVRDALVEGGFDVTLYTADGATPKMLGGGTLPDVLSVINFGDDPAGNFAEFAKFRSNVPRMAGEYYPGWFDHWGEEHHTGDLANVLRDIGWMLERKVSFSLYMFHGGTTFGFMNGANYSEKEPFQPDTSSYDYGAPLDEAGRPTPAYHALRKLIGQHLAPGETLPPVPPSPAMIAIPRFTLAQSAPLAALLTEPPRRAVRPLTMEELDQSYGFVWYRTRLPGKGKGLLEFGDVRDMALVYRAGKPLGVLDRRKGQRSIELDASADQPLDLLVENMGRINYGARLMDERKGLIGPARFGNKPLLEWEMYPLPLDDLSGLQFRDGDIAAPAFHRGAFNVGKRGDSYIDLRGWGRGHVWINGHHLGRYWRIGPQQSLLVPAEWLQRGRNEIVVLELESGGQRTVQGLTNPVFETHAETSVP
ncbi:glycoside hydrolase family 35 protein [Lysobacter tyrosinilyticus]